MTKSQKIENLIDNALERLDADLGWYSDVTYAPGQNEYKIKIKIPNYEDDTLEATVRASSWSDDLEAAFANHSISGWAGQLII